MLPADTLTRKAGLSTWEEKIEELRMKQIKRKIGPALNEGEEFSGEVNNG
jgi:hypothetical protein